jgi:hypothetical protein
MSYEVDFSSSRIFSIASQPGTHARFNTVWPGEFAPRLFFTLAISIEPRDGPHQPGDPDIYTNPSGTALTLVSYQYSIRSDGQQQITWEIRNDSNYELHPGAEVNPITFTINAISTPSQ